MAQGTVRAGAGTAWHCWVGLHQRTGLHGSSAGQPSFPRAGWGPAPDFGPALGHPAPHSPLSATSQLSQFCFWSRGGAEPRGAGQGRFCKDPSGLAWCDLALASWIRARAGGAPGLSPAATGDTHTDVTAAALSPTARGGSWAGTRLHL